MLRLWVQQAQRRKREEGREGGREGGACSELRKDTLSLNRSAEGRARVAIADALVAHVLLPDPRRSGPSALPWKAILTFCTPTLTPTRKLANSNTSLLAPSPGAMPSGVARPCRRKPRKTWRRKHRSAKCIR
jgi:hypothetical protein